MLLGSDSPTATPSSRGSSATVEEEPTRTFETESEDSAVNMEDTEPVLLRRARIFNGVLCGLAGMTAEENFDDNEGAITGGLYRLRYKCTIVEAVLWVYLLWLNAVVGHKADPHRTAFVNKDN